MSDRGTTIDGQRDPFGHSGQAALYAAYRPRYPEELLNALDACLKERKVAIDVATGTGQLASVLARNRNEKGLGFEHVIAVDRSSSQLGAALQDPRIEYRLATATDLSGIQDAAADAVVIGQALHWMEADLSRVLSETIRVLRPAGWYGVFGYAIARLGNPEMQQAFRKYYVDVLGSEEPVGNDRNMWECDRVLLDSGLERMLEPIRGRFQSCERLWHLDEREMPVGQFMAYMKTWSGYRSYRERFPERPDPLPELEQLFLKNATSGNMPVTFPFFLVLAQRAN